MHNQSLLSIRKLLKIIHHKIFFKTQNLDFSHVSKFKQLKRKSGYWPCAASVDKAAVFKTEAAQVRSGVPWNVLRWLPLNGSRLSTFWGTLDRT